MTEQAKEAGKRQMLTMRVTQALKDRISEAADANGRSVSQEIEMRLERTLHQDAELGDPEQSSFVRWLVTIMDTVSRNGQRSWLRDPDLFAQVRSASTLLFEAYEPGSVQVPTLAEVSDAGRAVISQWEADVGAKEAEVASHIRRATELYMKNKTVGLTDDEQAEMAAAFEAGKPRSYPSPELSEADAKAWGEYGRRQQLLKRSESALVQLIAAINAAKGTD